MLNKMEMTIHNLVVGDPTMSVKELWVCCRRMLIREKDHLMVEMGQRENVPVMMMGKITDTGRMVVKGSKTAVDVTVEMVLSELPQKTLMNYVPMVLLALDLPKDLTVLRSLHLLLSDVAVLS